MLERVQEVLEIVRNLGHGAENQRWRGSAVRARTLDALNVTDLEWKPLLDYKKSTMVKQFKCQ